MDEISRKPARTVPELASARQHQENPKTRPTIMERAVEGNPYKSNSPGVAVLRGRTTTPAVREKNTCAVDRAALERFGLVHEHKNT